MHKTTLLVTQELVLEMFQEPVVEETEPEEEEDEAAGDGMYESQVSLAIVG